MLLLVLQYYIQLGEEEGKTQTYIQIHHYMCLICTYKLNLTTINGFVFWNSKLELNNISHLKSASWHMGELLLRRLPLKFQKINNQIVVCFHCCVFCLEHGELVVVRCQCIYSKIQGLHCTEDLAYTLCIGLKSSIFMRK